MVVARTAGRISWGMAGHLFSCHIRASPVVFPCRLHWASSQHGCLRAVGLFHGSSEFQWKYFNSQGESHSDFYDITLEFMQHYFHCILSLTSESQDHKGRGIQFHILLRKWQNSIRACRWEILLLLSLENIEPFFSMKYFVNFALGKYHQSCF